LRQLLGKDYKLFNQQRRQQRSQAHERHKAQRHSKDNQFGTSNLGQHIDRLLAKAIVAIAKQYKAASIAVPKLDNIRPLLQAEIEAKAEQKVPGYVEGQKRYAKQYKINIHRWSYGRLIDQLASKAAQSGIEIETVNQPTTGTPQEKAKAVAIAAYDARSLVLQN
jgi:IS605 OrfB family transposase